MKTIATATVFIFSFFTAVCNTNAGDSPIEFRGYVEFDGEQLFSLKSTQRGGSAWVRLGQVFCEGKLINYDNTSKSVTFSSSKGTFKVKMLQAKELGDLAGNYGTSNQTDSIDTNHRAITVRGSIPRVLTTRIYEEEITERRDQLVDYNNPSKGATSSSSGGISKARAFKANGSEQLAVNNETLNHLGSGSTDHRLVIRRGSIPRVQTSRTLVEKEAAKQALNAIN